KHEVDTQVRINDQIFDMPSPAYTTQVEPIALKAIAARATFDALDVEVPLVRLAWARSGDKGDDANIGVIARRVEWLPLLRQQLTVESVKRYFAHLVEGTVERFDLPGIHGMNFLLHQALGGGGTASLRSDPLAKSFAQMLLDMPVTVPAQLLPLANTPAH
ncbi:MAG: terpene utilization protein AtuA, partial [Alcaligenaceae bacterium]